MKTTIRDIANQLGVSASTVSKVINGKGSISPELRQRVLAVVEQANYQPNLNAKSLRINRVKSVLNVNESNLAAKLLSLSHNVKSNGSLTGAFRTVYLNDTSSGNAAYSECHIK